MDYLKVKLAAGLSGICVAELICGVLGGWDLWLKVLILFVVLDYISGIMCSLVHKKLDSEVGFKGICRKAFIFILVAVAYNVDLLLGTEILRVAVIGFYITNEGISILENAAIAGLPVPNLIRGVLDKVKDSI